MAVRVPVERSGEGESRGNGLCEDVMVPVPVLILRYILLHERQQQYLCHV